MPPLEGTHIGLDSQTVGVFALTATASFVIDLWAHRADRPIALKAAVCWSVFWVAVAMLFALYLNLRFNPEVTSLFLAGYLFEQALSVDNLFVMMAIFAWFKVPDHLCHRVLYWGVLGAVLFRLIFVLIGASLFALGPWVELVFALLVGSSALMMLKGKKNEEDKEQDLSQHLAYRAVHRLLPVFPKFMGHNFFISKEEAAAALGSEESAALKLNGKWLATPLFLCLVIIETTDVMFAFDSVPAVIAVSREPLIIYSAMIFAVLGLRSMYFVLDALRRYLVHLEKAVTLLLFFIAFKLAAGASLHLWGVGVDISVYTSLAIIAVILGLGVLSSLIFPAGRK